MATYKDPVRANSLKRLIGSLRAVKGNLQTEAPYQKQYGLTTDLSSAVEQYASGSVLTSYQSQLATAISEANVVQAAINSALSALQTTLDSLEI